MLRVSSDRLGLEVDVAAVVDSTRDPLVTHGREILAFVDALVLDDPHELPGARRALVDAAGDAAAARVAAVAGNFEMMNRCLDAIGAPVGGFGRLADELGVTVPAYLRGP